MRGQQIFVCFICALLLTSCFSSENKLEEQLKAADSLILETESLLKSVDSLPIKQLIQDHDLNSTNTSSIGDVNGDGQIDSAIINPYTFYYRDGQIDSQFVNISFTCNIPSIKHYDGFNGLIVNVGDLDGNKTDELLYYPDWYQSNSAGIFIYGYKQNKWTLFAQTTIRRDILNETENPIKFLQSRVKKIDNKSFYLTEHCWRDTDIVDSIRTINIQ